MNQRLKRKIEKRRRQQICEALDLCLQINGLQKSDQEYTGNHPTAFCGFSGHVANVSVQNLRSRMENDGGPGQGIKCLHHLPR